MEIDGSLPKCILLFPEQVAIQLEPKFSIPSY